MTMTEQEVYQEIYRRQSAGENYVGYGSTNHGTPHLKRIKAVLGDDDLLLDVGCGHNELCIGLRADGHDAIGIDFACRSADFICGMANLPFDNKVFTLVSAFDVLEHLAEDQIDPALSELSRVGERFIFTIAFRPSVNTLDGRNLHSTVKDPDWWLAKIKNHGTVGEFNPSAGLFVGTFN